MCDKPHFQGISLIKQEARVCPDPRLPLWLHCLQVSGPGLLRQVLSQGCCPKTWSPTYQKQGQPLSQTRAVRERKLPTPGHKSTRDSDAVHSQPGPWDQKVTTRRASHVGLCGQDKTTERSHPCRHHQVCNSRQEPFLLTLVSFPQTLHFQFFLVHLGHSPEKPKVNSKHKPCREHRAEKSRIALQALELTASQHRHLKRMGHLVATQC